MRAGESRASNQQDATDGPLEIRTLTSGELGEAAAVLAQGMRDNPLHVEAFGADLDARHRRLAGFLGFLVGYVQANGEVLGAYAHGELVGVLGLMEPGGCRPTLMETLRFAGVVILSNPPGRVLAVRRWLAAWARNDPAGPHWHIGPFAVRPESQRQGIGRRLMAECRRRMDARAATAYLETDLAINVAFYETFGFVVSGQETVLGVPNWFMTRPPPAARRAREAAPAAAQGSAGENVRPQPT